MARLLTAGGEWLDLTADSVTAEVNSGATTSTANPRSGSGHFRATAAGANPGSSAAMVRYTFTGSLATTYYARMYISISTAIVTGTSSIMALRDSVGAKANIALDTSGNLILRNAITQIGSSIAIPGYGSYFMLELAATYATGSIDYAEGRLNGVSFASGSSLAITDNAPAAFVFGIIDSAATGQTTDVDDIAVNDSSGASQNSWPGSGKIVLLRPIALNTNGGSWTDDNAAITSAALTNAVDNTPPKGIADTTAGGGDHQVRNAGANSSLDMNLTTYATAGIAAADTINVVEPQVNVGAPVSTGAKSGSFGITTNPTIANRAFTGGSGTATFFWRGSAAGTYPSNWGWERGTVTYAPSVTVGTSPVARLTITSGTTSRVAMCDAMGLMVDYTPSAAIPPRYGYVSLPDVGMLMKRLGDWWRRWGLPFRPRLTPDPPVTIGGIP